MRTLILFAVLITPTAAFAQGDLPRAGEATGALDDGQTETKKVTEHDFDKGDTVTGETLKPDEEAVRGEVHGKRSVLIDIRSDFVEECLKSVEDI